MNHHNSFGLVLTYVNEVHNHIVLIPIYTYIVLNNHGVSRGIGKLLTDGEGPIRDSKPKLFNLGI